MSPRIFKKSRQTGRKEKSRFVEVPIAYQTELGQMLMSKIEEALEAKSILSVKGSVNLVFTSPPFPLTRKKKYGNLEGAEYLNWMVEISKKLADLLAPDGSIVLEIGNAWESGKPVMSTLPLETLLAIQKGADLHLCQEFICHNPARLPGPAQWVNIERIRVKDSFTHVWWMSKTDRPKADNRNVLVPYGKHMQRLLKKRIYNAGDRPSGHRIGSESFFKDNQGAIPASVLEYANTAWNEDYNKWCKEIDVPPHPARMSPNLAEFFINFLTGKGDLVLDPFAGSNTTGAASEYMGRRWIAVEPNNDYVKGSMGRFEQLRSKFSRNENPE
jgi:DNA modification methylase